MMPNLWVFCYLVGLTTLDQAIAFSVLFMEENKICDLICPKG